MKKSKKIIKQVERIKDKGNEGMREWENERKLSFPFQKTIYRLTKCFHLILTFKMSKEKCLFL